MRLARPAIVWRAAVCLLALVVTGLTAATSAHAAPDRRTDSLRVLSYNIHHGAGVDGVLDLERIARDIEASGAEVIGLQEVDNHWGERSDWVDQAAWLADRLGMYHVFGANLDLPPAEGQTHRQQYGTAILSRYPITRSSNRLLTSIEYPERPTEQRGLLHAEIDVRNSKIDVYSTHLDHQRTEQRLLQAQEVRSVIDIHRGTAILTGDMNADPGTEEIDLLTSEPFVDSFAGSDGDFTYPAEAPKARIDYLIGYDVLSITDAEVYDSQASDHRPLGATVTFRRPQR